MEDIEDDSIDIYYDIGHSMPPQPAIFRFIIYDCRAPHTVTARPTTLPTVPGRPQVLDMEIRSQLGER